MSWQFYLRPSEPAKSFSSDALSLMSSWWEKQPTYRRSDGVIVLCFDAEYRNSVLQGGRADEVNACVEVIRLAPDQITFGIMGWEQMVETLYQFVKFAEGLTHCKMLTETGKAITAENFRDGIYKLSDPRAPQNRDPTNSGD